MSENPEGYGRRQYMPPPGERPGQEAPVRRQWQVLPGEEEYRHLFAIVNASRDAIWSWRSDGTIVSWNAGAERLFQFTAEEIIGRPVFTLIPPERHDHARAVMSSLLEGKGFGQYEEMRLRKDGARIPVELTVSPILDDEDRVVGAATICRDIARRKRAERASQRLAAIVDSSNDAIVAKDLDGVITNWNAGAERLFGYRADEVLGQPVTILVPPDHRHEETRILACIRRGQRVEPFDTVRRRKDGSLVDVSLTISPIRDAKGHIVGVSNITRDITERKQAERVRQLLTGELRHRVKNTLAVVQAMANQTFRKVPAASEALRIFGGRIAAMAAAHDLLIRESWERASLAELVDRVVETAGQGARVTVEGPPVTLEPRAAVTVGLALHELCTNAIKHGALSSPAGTVAVSWSVTPGPGPRLSLSWQERGGPAVSRPTRRGFGMMMLEKFLAQYLEGEVSVAFRPEGLTCSICLALPSAEQGLEAVSAER